MAIAALTPFLCLRIYSIFTRFFNGNQERTKKINMTLLIQWIEKKYEKSDVQFFDTIEKAGLSIVNLY